MEQQMMGMMMEMMQTMGMPMGGKGGGKGNWGGGGKGCDWGGKGASAGSASGGWQSNGNWKPDYNADPVAAAIKDALEPVASLDTSWTLQQMEEKIGRYVYKTSLKFKHDERMEQRGSAVQAQALVESFVDTTMGAISAACYDKAWYPEANFAGPLYAQALQTFSQGKLFSRVLAPSLQRYIEEALFRFRDEERIQRAFQEAINNVGLSNDYHKKCNKQLSVSFDEAHTNAPYGTSRHELPAMRVLQDFVLGWMKEFVKRSWDVIENGVSGDKESQLIFLTALFQSLTGPDLRALPFDIVGLFENEAQLPGQGWDYVAICAQSIFEEWDQLGSRPSAKKMRKGF